MDTYAIILSNSEMEVEDAIMHRNDNELCALVMMAWHLVDDSASLSWLYNVRDRDFTDREFAVWAVVAFFRDLWSLSHFLDEKVFMTYLEYFLHLVSVLRRHGIHVLVVTWTIFARSGEADARHCAGVRPQRQHIHLQSVGQGLAGAV
jgi:hypothetical protein